jgi:hypothetical protein
MIITDTTRIVPTEWTKRECQDLFEHARALGQEGNPAGFGLTVDLHPFVGYSDEEGHHLRYFSEWDYDSIRAYIAEHPERIQRIWQWKIVGW